MNKIETVVYVLGMIFWMEDIYSDVSTMFAINVLDIGHKLRDSALFAIVKCKKLFQF